MSKKILIMAGGTGGHIFPALAIAKELKERGAVVEWLGGKNAMESRLVPRHSYKFNGVSSSGLRGKNLLVILKAFFLPRLFCTKNRRVASYTMGQFWV